MQVKLKYLIFTLLGCFLIITLAGNAQDRQDESSCTVALIAGWATPDGRPLMWKNRDVSDWHQEFNFYDLEPYTFIAVNYPDNLDEAYGGVNEVGFAIMNANALNFPDSLSGVDDDGFIMLHALQTCETVADFRSYMDTTAISGRTRTANYGVLDAYGNGGMLEASTCSNFWYDLYDTTVAPQGIIVRANFAYAGSTNHPGQFRHDRALELISAAVADSIISPAFLTDIVARDLVTETLNPYPLPYQGWLGDTLYGCIRTHNAINREITQSAFAVKGVLIDENPLLSTLWVQCGEPTLTPAHPLWVAAGSVPDQVDGEPYAPINLRARELYQYLYLGYPDPYDDILNTFKLVDLNGQGLLTEIRNLEASYYDSVENLVGGWRSNFPPAAEVADLQNYLAKTVFEAMIEPQPVNDVYFLVLDEGLKLCWPPVLQSVFGDTFEISGYIIYSCDNAFLNGVSGDSVGFTADTTFILPPVTAADHTFYQVRAVKWEEY